MKKVRLTSFLLICGFLASGVVESAPAQIGIGANRFPKNQKKAQRLRPADPQLGRRNNRPLNPRQQQMRQLQQRIMQELGLTPEQRARMAEIRRSHEEEAIELGRRLRMARESLDRAIMSPQLNEELVRQRAEEFTAAQADSTRLQVRVRTEVRSVLTTDQVVRFIEAERRLRREMREQRERQLLERERNIQQGHNLTEPVEDLDMMMALLFAS